MPGTITAVQRPTSGGLNPTFAAPGSTTISFSNNGTVLAYVKNGSGASINVTANVEAPDVDGLTIPNKVVAVPAAGERIIGPFPVGVYNFADGTMDLVFSAITSVTVALIQVP